MSDNKPSFIVRTRQLWKIKIAFFFAFVDLMLFFLMLYFLNYEIEIFTELGIGIEEIRTLFLGVGLVFLYFFIYFCQMSLL